MRRTMVVIALSSLLALPVSAQTRDQNADRCKGDDANLAIPACTALITGNTETTEGISIAYNNRANAYINKDDNDSAIRDLNEAIRLRPNYDTAYYNRGIAYSNKNDPRRAIQDFDEAIRISPKYVGALNNRGSAYDDLGQYQRAVQDYNAVLAIDPNHGMAINNRGIAYKNLGQYPLAERDFDRALQIDSNKTNRWANRCWVRAILNKLDGALSDCNRSLQINASYGDARDARGVTYLKLKNADAAIADFTAAIGSDSRDAVAFYGRSLAKRMKGDSGGANDDLASARRHDSTIEQKFGVYGVRLAGAAPVVQTKKAVKHATPAPAAAHATDDRKPGD